MWLSLTNEIKLWVVAIYNQAIVTVMSECCVKSVICKTWTWLSAVTLGNSAVPDQMLQNTASDQGLHCLLKLQEVKG